MRAASERKLTRNWPLFSGIAAIVMAGALGALIAYRAGNLPLAIDTAWMNEILEHRSPFWLEASLVMNWLGGGLIGVLIVPLGTVAVLCLFRRFWAALYYAVAAAASAGLVQLLKGIFERPRPEDILVLADVGSFPSGHVANAATIAVTLGIILGRGWVWAAGAMYTVLMMLSRTYLGAHWLSDTVGGLVLGAGVVVVVWAPFAARLSQERDAGRRSGALSGDTR